MGSGASRGSLLSATPSVHALHTARQLSRQLQAHAACILVLPPPLPHPAPATNTNTETGASLASLYQVPRTYLALTFLQVVAYG